MAGESITLTAAPDSGWQVESWTGTSNNSSTAVTNTLSMPAGAHAASVAYVVTPPSSLTCENYESGFTLGQIIGTHADWLDGAGPVVTAGSGVAGSNGLGTATTIYNWTAHPFNWNAADLQKVVLQQDFQSSGWQPV